MDMLSWIGSGSLLVGALALIFGFSNGYRDASTVVATVVSTRALAPNRAFLWCGLFEFLGALFIGTAVVATIGEKLFATDVQLSRSQFASVVGCGLISAIFWGLMSWWRRWPISNTQALFAGVIGASFASWGIDPLNHTTILILFMVLISSPLIGFIISVMCTVCIRRLGEWMTPRVQKHVQHLQVLSCFFVSAVRGSNDGQIIMGMLILAFGLMGGWSGDTSTGIPMGLRFIVAFMIGFGVILGGKRLLKRMGMQFYHIRPTQGLGAQMSSAATILSCVLCGFPASAMQVMTGSIVGAGVAKNPKAIRWQIAQEIVISWFITLPCAGLLGFILAWMIQYIVRGS